jgi:hypothetical protein
MRKRTKQIGNSKVENYAILADYKRFKKSKNILDIRYTYNEEGVLIEASTDFKFYCK